MNAATRKITGIRRLNDAEFELTVHMANPKGRDLTIHEALAVMSAARAAFEDKFNTRVMAVSDTLSDKNLGNGTRLSFEVVDLTGRLTFGTMPGDEKIVAPTDYADAYGLS